MFKFEVQEMYVPSNQIFIPNVELFYFKVFKTVNVLVLSINRF
jgi:hypothetical protein